MQIGAPRNAPGHSGKAQHQIECKRVRHVTKTVVNLSIHLGAYHYEPRVKLLEFAIVRLDCMVIRTANNSASMKRSGYLRHKLHFVNEEVRQKNFTFRKLAGDHNAADSFTKYTAFAKWKMHMEFVRNSKIIKVEG